MVFLFAAAAAQILAAGTPAFDPRQHKSEIAGRPTQVMVLGSPHLSQLPEKLDPALLDSLLNRLEAFRPAVITIEGLNGEECDTLRRFDAQHQAWKTYCFDTADAEKATGLSVPAAMTEVQKTLASWPANPSAASRRRLAMLFLASGDRASAKVQWLRLPAAERHAGDGLIQAMVDVIDGKGKPLNENYAIGSALAARLGLERVYPADDHLADSPDSDPAAAETIQRAWNAPPKPPLFAEYKRRQSNLHTSADVMSYFRWLNSPATQRAAISADMGRAARENSASHFGRQYVSWWEQRNLRMAANIRAAFLPQQRVLVIVGSTHKGYLDAYLNMMQDVRLVDAEQFLR
jgi:hypothetical protein